MKQEQKPESSGQEVKSRATVWLYPSTWDVIDTMLSEANCKTRSEFIERAAQFFAGYISGQEATAYLPAALVAALQGTVKNSEARTARLLFKLSVEVAMMAKVFAIGLKIDPKDLERVRAQCVQEVKKTNGSISFQEAVERERVK